MVTISISISERVNIPSKQVLLGRLSKTALMDPKSQGKYVSLFYDYYAGILADKKDRVGSDLFSQFNYATATFINDPSSEKIPVADIATIFLGFDVVVKAMVPELANDAIAFKNEKFSTSYGQKNENEVNHILELLSGLRQ